MERDYGGAAAWRICDCYTSGKFAGDVLRKAAGGICGKTEAAVFQRFPGKYGELYSLRAERQRIAGKWGRGLSGRGILMGVVDSGVDYRHPDFRNEDGTTRILSLWDQSGIADEAQSRRPPQGYSLGVEYTKEMIDSALALPAAQGYQIVPERDFSGHGTSVLGLRQATVWHLMV